MTIAARADPAPWIEPPECPFKGLDAFEDSDVDAFLFFGREREREIVIANLTASRLTVLYGPSGVGKSSLLGAGVAYSLGALARRNVAEIGAPELAVVVFDSWSDEPTEALIAAISRAVSGLGDAPAQPLGGTIAESLAAASDAVGGDVYLVLDQVEELFLSYGRHGGLTVVDELAEIIANRELRVHVLVAMREEALSSLDALKGRVRDVFGNYLRLDHLERASAREAIAGPVERYNQLVPVERRMAIEPELIDTLLDEVAIGAVDPIGDGRSEPSHQPDTRRVEAPYLQLVLERLWQVEHEHGSRILRLATLRELGGAETIVRSHFDEAVAGLPEDQRDLAASVFDHLVTPSGTKIAHTASDLAGYAGVPEEELRPVLDDLARQRVLRITEPAPPGGKPRFEIFHDILAEPATAWRRTRVAEQELARARRRHRRLLLVVGACLLAVAAMIGVTVFAISQRSEARDQARLAQSRELAASALASLPDDPELGLLLALEAARTERTPQAESALRDALDASRVHTVFAGHDGPVTQVAFDPEGSLFLTVGDDRTVRLVDAGTGQELHALEHDADVTGAGFSSDGSLIVTSSADGGVRVWSVEDGTLLSTFHHEGPVAGASFLEGGGILSWSADGSARLWSPAGNVLVLRHGAPVAAAAIDPAGAVVATAGEDGTARLFDARTGALLHVLPHEKSVTGVDFSPDGTLLITAGKERLSRIWEVESGELVHELGEHRGVVTSAAFAPDGTLSVTTSADGGARTWDVATGVRTAIFAGHANSVGGAAFSPDGTLVVTVSSDRTARVSATSTGRLMATLVGHRDTVTDAEFAPDGQTVVTASLDGTARVWDAAADPLLEPLAHLGSATTASFTPDGRSVLAVPQSGRPRLLDAQTGEPVRWFEHDGATAAATSGDGELLATARGTELRLWPLREDGPARSLTSEVPVRSVELDETGERILVVGDDGVARVLDPAEGEPLLVIRSPDDGFTTAAFSPDGSLVATGDSGGLAAIWDARTGELRHELEGHTEAVTNVAFSSAGRRLVTTSLDGDGRIWDARTGAQLQLLRGHYGPVFDAMFSPDGRWVVTAGPVTAGLWDASTGRLRAFLRGHSAVLTSAGFDPTGNWILTAGRAGNVRIYRCETCGPIASLEALAEERLAQIGRTLSPAERAKFLAR
jgi:WD40 repeat protein